MFRNRRAWALGVACALLVSSSIGLVGGLLPAGHPSQPAAPGLPLRLGTFAYTTTPAPSISSVSAPKSINLGQTADIWVNATNGGGAASWQTITVSFPTNPPSANVAIISSDANISHTGAPGVTWPGCYSTCNVTLNYTLAEEVALNWSSGVVHHLEVAVTPNQPGTFTFYYKSVGSGYGGNYKAAAWDPTSGSKDQQGEYDYSQSFQVRSTNLTLLSEYSGAFLTNYSLSNTFGVYPPTSLGTPTAVWGLLGGSNLSFVAPPARGGSYNLTVNMGGVSPGSVLKVYLQYPGVILNASEPIQEVSEPAWLGVLLTAATVLSHFTRGSLSEWETGYSVDAAFELNLSKAFGLSVPITFASKQYTLVPSVGLDFEFDSGGTVTLTGDLQLEAPVIAIADIQVAAHVILSVSGTLSVHSGTIVWTNSTMTLDLGGSAQVTVPTPAGFSFSFFGQTFKVGLTVTVTLSPDVALVFLFGPSASPASSIFPGLDIALQKLSGMLSFAANIDAAFDVPGGLLSLHAGGTATASIDVAAKGGGVALSNGTLKGTVYVSGEVPLLGLKETLSISESAKFASPIPSNGSAPLNFSNFSAQPRYYNVSGYDATPWVNGAWSGPLWRNAYPFATASQGSAGTTTAVVTDFDNTSRPLGTSLSLQGLLLNGTSRSVRTLPLPSLPGEVADNPQVAMVNPTTAVATWIALPFTGSSGFNLSGIHRLAVQSAVLDLSSGRWGSIQNVTTSGFAQSVGIDVSTGEPFSMALVGSGLVPSGAERLLITNLSSNLVVGNLSVTNVSAIDSSSLAAGVIVLKSASGTPQVIDAGSGRVIPLPGVPGYSVGPVHLVHGNGSEVSVLYDGPGSDLLELDTVNGTVLRNWSLPAGLLDASIVAGSRPIIVTASGNAATVYRDNGSELAVIRAVAEPGLQQLLVGTEPGALALTSLERSGPPATPRLDVNLTWVPTTPPPPPSLHLGGLTPSNVTLRWSDPIANQTGVAAYLVYSAGAGQQPRVIANLSASQTALAVRTAPGVPQGYWVRSTSVLGTGAFSNGVGFGIVNLTSYGQGHRNWSATIDHSRVRAVNGSAIVPVPWNTTVPFVVVSPKGFFGLPSSGNVTTGDFIAYLPVAQNKIGTPVYPLTFSDRLLAPGTYWEVNVRGVIGSSTGPNITFYEPNGSYRYQALIPFSSNSTGHRGSVTVAGAPAVVSLRIHQPAVGLRSPGHVRRTPRLRDHHVGSSNLRIRA